MTSKITIDYQDIEKTPPKEFLALSFHELEDLINQARENKSNATLILDWLTAIKLEKIIREDITNSKAEGEEAKTSPKED